MKKILIIALSYIMSCGAATVNIPMSGWGHSQFNAISATVSSTTGSNEYCTVRVRGTTPACADSQDYWFTNVYCGNSSGGTPWSGAVNSNYCGTAKNAWLGTSIPYILGIEPGAPYNHSGACNIKFEIGYGGGSFNTNVRYAYWNTMTVSGMSKSSVISPITFTRASANCINDLTSMGVTWGRASGVNVSSNIQLAPASPSAWTFCISVDGNKLNCSTVTGGSVTPPDPVVCNLAGDDSIDFGSIAPEDVSGKSTTAYLTLSCTGVGNVQVSVLSGSSTTATGIKHVLSDSLYALVCLVPTASTSCNSTPSVLKISTSSKDVTFGVKALLSGSASAGDYGSSVVILYQQY